MRLTVLHVDKNLDRPRPTDVDVVPGTTVAALRDDIARLTGQPEWASVRCALTVDGVRVDDAHPAGLAPLLPGAVLSVDGRAAPPAERRVLASARHIAVTGGPDTGALLPLGETREATIGPGAALDVRDEGWGPVRLSVRVRTTGRRAGLRRTGGMPAPLVRVRATGPAVMVVERSRMRRSRPIPRRRWRRWPLGAEVRVGASVLELRDTTARLVGDPTTSAFDEQRAPRPPDRVGRVLRGTSGAQISAMAVSTAGTVVTGLVLALAVHQPLLALTGLTGPLLWWASRRRDGAPSAAARDEHVLVAPDVAALRLSTATGSPSADVRVPAAWDAGGCLAVVGPRDAVMSAARAVAVGELGTRGECDVAVRGRNRTDWAWLVWTGAVSAALPAPVTAGDDQVPSRRGLVIVDGPDEVADVARWRAHAPASHRLLWVGADPAGVPSWCRNVVTVSPTRAELRSGDRPPRALRPVGVRADVAEAQARALGRAAGTARVPGLRTSATGVHLTDCPDAVALGSLPGIPSPDESAIGASWATADRDLRTPLGIGADGEPVVLDLVRDGPHAVVAGTTGAGKSELLTTLVLGLALAHPPHRLAVLLVDFKGGTGLPGLASLPHVVGRLSDLDAGGARRVLLGLGAELRRRERLVAEAGVRDVEELRSAGRDGGGPARLLVVIDEFRALADDLPELLPGLGRLAAQGRSLGVHLVLATQRPAGAVPAELRANVSLRVALRVLDPADSVDLVGVPDAAQIDSATPGRAVLVRGGGAAQAVQVARADVGATRDAVQLADLAADLLDPRSYRAWTPAARGSAPAPDQVARWVDAARAAAQGLPRPDVPWLPELPARLDAEEVASGPGLALAVADLPDEQRRGAVRWDPGSGHLLVLGGPRSGRTTTLVAVGRQALAAGLDVHAIGLPPAGAAELSTGVPGRLGTVARADDAVTTARLLEALTRDTSTGSRAVLLVDGLELVLDRLGTLARGAAADLLTALWTRSDLPVSLAASAAVTPLSARLLGSFADRLVLGVADPSLDTLAGVPAALVGPRVAPGRAVHVRAATAALCQVALPARWVTTGTGRHTTAPVRLAPPPTTARRGAVAARRGTDGRLLLPLGLGSDGRGLVEVDVQDSLLVVGPPASGRTTTLSWLSASLARLGTPTVALAQPVGAAAAVTRDELLALLGAGGDLVALVDDLDELERTEPALSEALADRLIAQRRFPDTAPGLRVVAGTTTSHAASSFRGLVPVMLRARRLLALDLREPGSVDLLGAASRWLADPSTALPGRGALRQDGTVLPVQVWAPGTD